MVKITSRDSNEIHDAEWWAKTPNARARYPFEIKLQRGDDWMVLSRREEEFVGYWTVSAGKLIFTDENDAIKARLMMG